MTEIRLDELELKPLTDWQNAPTIRDLKQDIEDADIDNVTHKANVERWLDSRNMTGASAPKKIKGRSSIAPRTIRKQAEWRYSSLSDPFLSTPDIFNVSPKSAGDRVRAQQNSMVLNHQFNSYINKVAFFDALVRDDVDVGTGIVEVSWVTEDEAITREEPVYEYTPVDNPAIAQQYIALVQLRQTSEDAYQNYMNPGLDKAIQLYMTTGQLVQANQVGTEEVTEIEETANYPALEVVESENILIDPTCDGDLNKAQFVGRRLKSSLSALRKDSKYKNLEHIRVESANPLTDPDYKSGPDAQSFGFKDEPRKQFVVHTYWGNWDIHDTGTTVAIVASWVGDTMIRMEENPFPFRKPPFAKVVYMPVRKSSFGEPDSELIEDNQKVIGAVTRGIIDLMGKSANGQTGTRVNFLDAANKRKFARGDDYEFQGGQGMRPEDSVHQHTYPETPSSAYNMLGLQNNEVESMSGFKAFTSGINSQALGDNVGGGRDAMDAASKREAGILLRLGECVKDIGRMIIAMNAEFLSDEEVVRITDEKFVTVRRDDLVGKFDLALSISTAEEDNRRAQELSFMLQTTGPNGDPVEVRMIRAEIARLRKMPDFAKRIEEYEPKPDPLAVLEQELKVKLLEAQIEKEIQLGNKHGAEAEAAGYRGYKDGTQGDLNASKVGTEGAKERNLHSDSDKKDQDYLEQHTGTAHAKELDIQDRKAVNDLESTIVKSELGKQNKDNKEQ